MSEQPKPPYYYGITTALTGRIEGSTVYDPEYTMKYAKSLRASALFGNANRQAWQNFIITHPDDPAAIFVGEAL